MCKSLEKEGQKVRPVAVIELCKPDYAAELLSSDNTRLVSRLFREKIAEVMAIATRETEAILNQALAR